MQVVMHEIGLTQNTVDTIGEFINGIEESCG